MLEILNSKNLNVLYAFELYSRIKEEIEEMVLDFITVFLFINLIEIDYMS